MHSVLRCGTHEKGGVFRGIFFTEKSVRNLAKPLFQSTLGWLKVLSEKLIMEEKIKSICKKDRTAFRRGMGFDGITVLNPGFCGSMLCGPVTFRGRTGRNEMLFSSGNGRYYFTVRDGWGVEDNHLYALSIGAIRRDYQRPVTVEDIESIVNSPKESRGAYAALANAMKQKDDTEILKVLWD